MEHDLIVAEEYISYVMQLLRRAGSDLDNIVESYINVLRRIKIDSIILGDVSNELNSYIERVEALRGQMNYMAQHLGELYISFKREVNDADSYLF